MKIYYLITLIYVLVTFNVNSQGTLVSWPLQGTTAGVGSTGITVHPVALGSGVVNSGFVNAPTKWCNASTGCSGLQTKNWASANTSLNASSSAGNATNYSNNCFGRNHYVEFSFTLDAGQPSIQIDAFKFDISAGFTTDCTGEVGYAIHFTKNSTTIDGNSLISGPMCTWDYGYWINGSENGACETHTIDTDACTPSRFPITVNANERVRFRVYIGTTRDNETWRALFGNAEIIGSGISPLAVSLNDFNANCENNETILNWSTSSEENSSHFEVERSEDTQTWETVATVPASGYSNSTKYYSAKDINRFTDVGYYRLREVDNDGVHQVYKSVAVNCTSNENNLVVYPNPSNGDFSVEINSDEPLEQAAVVVYDISGKQVQRREINHSMVGSNMISFSNTKMEKGAYLIVIESKNKNNFKPEKLVIN